MSMQEERFVLNKQADGSVALIHRIDCATIQHQINHEIQYQYPLTRMEGIGSDSEGRKLYRETIQYDIDRYKVIYITKSELLHSDLRYRPCRICNPDVLSRAERKPCRVHVRNLNEHHIGKYFFKYGILKQFTVTVSFSDADRRPSMIVDACFEGDVKHRFRPDDVLEYSRTDRPAKKSS